MARRKKNPAALPLSRDRWDTPPAEELAHITADLQPLAIPIEAIAHLPGNAHQGDLGAVSASLQTFTQRVPLVVNRTTGHIEKGNTTWDAIVASGRRWVAAILVDDDLTTEKAFALADNRTQQLGFDDPALLAALLIEVQLADDDLFAATAFDNDDLDRLLADLNITIENTDPNLPAAVTPWLPPINLDKPRPAADHTPTRTVRFEVAVPFNLRQALTERLNQLMNETATLTTGEALAAHFNLRPLT